MTDLDWSDYLTDEEEKRLRAIVRKIRPSELMYEDEE